MIISDGSFIPMFVKIDKKDIKPNKVGVWTPVDSYSNGIEMQYTVFGDVSYTSTIKNFIKRN